MLGVEPLCTTQKRPSRLASVFKLEPEYKVAVVTDNAALCSSIAISIQLPDCKLNDIELDITETQLVLCTNLHQLNLNLPQKIQQGQGTAEFNKDSNELLLLLPVADNLITTKFPIDTVQNSQRPSLNAIDEVSFEKEKPTFKRAVEFEINQVADKLMTVNHSSSASICCNFTVHQDEEFITIILRERNLNNSAVSIECLEFGFKTKIDNDEYRFTFPFKISTSRLHTSPANVCIVSQKMKAQLFNSYCISFNGSVNEEVLLTMENINSVLNEVNPKCTARLEKVDGLLVVESKEYMQSD